jgi:hypothetical protein
VGRSNGFKEKKMWKKIRVALIVVGVIVFVSGATAGLYTLHQRTLAKRHQQELLWQQKLQQEKADFAAAVENLKKMELPSKLEPLRKQAIDFYTAARDLEARPDFPGKSLNIGALDAQTKQCIKEVQEKLAKLQEAKEFIQEYKQ